MREIPRTEPASEYRAIAQSAGDPGGGAERLLDFVLGGLILMPPLTVFFGFGFNGQYFILYREPKLVVVEFLGWLFLLVFFLRPGQALNESGLSRVLRRPEVLLLGGFVACSLLSSLWALVKENAFYENQQWVLLFLLFVTLLIRTGSTGGETASKVESLLIASMAGVSLISLLQISGVLKFLLPVQPANGVFHTSTMGYKNPLALALLCQVFFLAGRAGDPRRSATQRVVYSIVLGGELLLLLSLGSRSALLGLMAGVLLATLLLVARFPGMKGSRKIIFSVALLAAAVGAILGSAALFHEDRVLSMIKLLRSPTDYFQTDRGVYFLNTLEMVREHPFGVGAGNWQSAYPVYRRHEPALAFNLDIQVRRAHSDLVQIFGELGWPGLILYSALLLSLAIRLIRRVLKKEAASRLFDPAQLVAIVVAGLTDYCLETPYLKFEIILVFFILAAGLEPIPFSSVPFTGKKPWTLLRILVVCSALLGMIHALCLGIKLEISGQVRSYSLSHSPPGTEELADIRVLEERLSRCPGHFKTLFRDHLLLAAIEYRAGNPARARAELESSLRLHPYDPNAFLLAAQMAATPEEAARWKRLAGELLEGSLRPSPILQRPLE